MTSIIMAVRSFRSTDADLPGQNIPCVASDLTLVQLGVGHEERNYCKGKQIEIPERKPGSRSRVRNVRHF